LEGYEIVKEEFWIKNQQNRWILSEKEKALDFEASMGSWNSLTNICALGCFVLRRP
jgi:hypothetical protein